MLGLLCLGKGAFTHPLRGRDHGTVPQKVVVPGDGTSVVHRE